MAAAARIRSGKGRHSEASPKWLFLLSLHGLRSARYGPRRCSHMTTAMSRCPGAPGMDPAHGRSLSCVDSGGPPWVVSSLVHASGAKARG